MDGMHLLHRARFFDWNCDRDFRSFTEDTHAYRSLVALLSELRAQVNERANLFTFDLNDHVTGLQACLFGGRPGTDFADEHASIVGRTKIGTQLTGEIFRVDSENGSPRVHDVWNIRPLLHVRHRERIRSAEVAHLSLHLSYGHIGAVP